MMTNDEIYLTQSCVVAVIELVLKNFTLYNLSCTSKGAEEGFLTISLYFRNNVEIKQ